jgi:signal transduction histidine kinase
VVLNATAIKDEAGNFLMSRGTIFDITARRQVEEALRESEKSLRYLTSQILTAQEQERKRIAMDLHESLGQSMSALKLRVRLLQRHLPTDAANLQEDFEGVQQLLSHMIEEVRQIAWGLMPTILENLGLTAALTYLLEDFLQYQGISIHKEIDDIQNFFSPQNEINLFRVFQESLHNIAKHARATLVSIIVKRQDGKVDFFIKDNGVGFDPQQIKTEKFTENGMGLAAMDERLRMIGARLHITSQPGTGTEISFSIPGDDN